MATTANKDYYGILGVKKTATPEEIRKAFRKAARKYRREVMGDLPPRTTLATARARAAKKPTANKKAAKPGKKKR